MLDIIDELELKPSDNTLEKTYNWYDTKYKTVPNIIDLELNEAKKQLKGFTVNYSGNGNIIKQISPTPGTIIPENSTIKVLLGN